MRDFLTGETVLKKDPGKKFLQGVKNPQIEGGVTMKNFRLVRRVFVGLIAGVVGFSELSFAQAEKGFNLGQVIVTATKTEHTLGDVPVSADVITKDELEMRGVKTVQDALELVSGIKVNKNVGRWGDKGKVEIFGLDSKHTLILLDGQRILGGHAAAVDLQQISTAMVERIEVVKGPASALYGSDAMGGVINIITKSASKKPTLSFSSSFGSRNTQIQELNTGFSAGKFGDFLSFTHRQSNGVHKKDDQYWEDIFYSNMKYELSPQMNISLKPYYSKNKMKNGGRKQERIGLNSVWEWAPDELSKLKLRNSWFNYKNWKANKKSNWHTNSYETELDYSRLIMNKHTLTLGYQYWKEEIDDKGKPYSARQRTNSFFVQDEADFSPFVFVLGVRTDDHDKWGTETNPKFSILYKATDNLKLRASVGRAFRGPTLVKLYADDWRMGPYLVHSNPDLEPEKSWGYQAGLEYKFSKKILAKLSFFRNNIDNLISYRTVKSSHPWGLYWENIKDAHTQGVEFNLMSYPLKNLTANLGYTYLDTEDETTGRELTYKANHKLTLDLAYKIPAVDADINFETEYIGRRYSSRYERLGGYTIFNLALNKNIGKYAQIFARVDNIFGKKDIPDEYDIDGTEFLGGLKVEF